ncbi:DUF7426 family protein [Arthrobacter sp. TMN-50]
MGQPDHHANLFERGYAGERCLWIPVRGLRYKIKPLDVDQSWFLAQVAAAEESDQDPHPSLCLSDRKLTKLVLGKSLQLMREDKPGGGWIQGATLTAARWHLQGLPAAQTFWVAFLDQFVLGGRNGTFAR